MNDLEASIYVMPRAIFDKLHVSDLKPTRVIIQLVERSNMYLDGVLEDVLV